MRKRVALYLRLSDEDRDKSCSLALSESIKNQELMLTDYAKAHDWQIVGIYNDEDYSGSDINRPQFYRLITDCSQGKIDIVLAKSQARFARDMELIEHYLYNKFIEWHVHFISMIDHIDNHKVEMRKTSQILGLTDQWYLEDTSHNIRATLKTKRENGLFTGAFAPYGYKKDPKNKNHLIPDYPAAYIVKDIFTLYSEGWGLERIARYLNEKDLPSPLEYKLLHGSKLKIPHAFNHSQFVMTSGIYEMQIAGTNKSFSYLFLPQSFKNMQLLSLHNLRIYYPCHNKYVLLNECEIVPSDTRVIKIISDNKHSQALFTFSYIGSKPYKPHLISKEEMLLTFHKKNQWSLQSIKNILSNEVYLGNLLQFKTTEVSYKNHQRIYNAESEWIRVDNVHPAIISKTLWDTVHNRLYARTRMSLNGQVHILANKVFCAECGRPFLKCGRQDANGYSYLCCKDKRNKWANCQNRKYLSEAKLHETILTAINQVINTYYCDDLLKKNEQNRALTATREDDAERDYQELLLKYQNVRNLFTHAYEDYCAGLLNSTEFLLLKKKYQENIMTLNREIAYCHEQKNASKDLEKETDFAKYRQIKTLSSSLVNALIKRIEIKAYDCLNNQRPITIFWRF